MVPVFTYRSHTQKITNGFKKYITQKILQDISLQIRHIFANNRS